MLFDWKSVCLFIGAAQGIILGFILLTSKGRNKHKRIFGLLMFFFALILIEYGIFRSQKGFHNAIHLFGYRYPLRFSIGPLFLFYTLKLTQKAKLPIKKIIVHFIPSITSLLLLFPLLIKSGDNKLNILSYSFNVIEQPYYYCLIAILAISSVLSLIIYVGISLKQMNQYKKTSLEFHSNENKIFVFDFQLFTKVYLIILIGYLLSIIFRVFQFEPFNVSNLFLAMSFLFMINLLALTFTVFRQNEIVPLELAIIKNESNTVVKNEKEIRKEDLDIIEKAMLEKELFLDYNFTITDLAEELEIPAYLLSKNINKGFNKTFFSYVNEFRIKHAKKLLENTDIKILAVALDSGFSNKTSFHRTFKRIMGTTPYEYRLHHKKKNNTF